MITIEDLRARARDLALLSVLRPEDDPETGLSWRQNTPEAARYRTVLDRVLANQKTPRTVRRRVLPPSTAPLDPGEWNLEQPVQEFPGSRLAPQYFQPLTEPEEQGFQQFYAKYAAQTGLDPNPDDRRHAYNYRAWWRAMQQDPERFSPQIDPEDQKLHGPSLFKAAGHPNRFVNVEGREIDTITEQPRRRAGVTLDDLKARAAGILVPETTGQSGATLESLKARTKHLVVPEQSSSLESFYEGAVKTPARNLYAGYLQSGGGLYDLGANALEIFGKLGAMDREGKRRYRSETEQLRGFAQEMYGESLQYMDDNILAKVYQGLGAAPGAIAELISGTRLLGTATRGFAAVEALHAADKGAEEVALATVRGALTGKAFEAAAPLTRPPRVAALTTIGGAQGVAAGGDVEDITAGAATLGILGLTGGRGHVSLRDLRRRAAKAQRQEPTIARPGARTEDVLELTERVEPTTATPSAPAPARPTAPAPAPVPEVRPEAVSQAPRAEVSIVDEAGPQPLFRMSIEEVDAVLREKSLSDNQKLLKALGSEERVKRFKQLDRARNSMDPRRGDAASAKFDQEFGDLTAEQERLIYGIGETDLQVDAIKEVRTARRNAETFADDAPAEIAGEVAFAMRRSEPAEIKKLLERGTGPAETQAALVTIEGGFRELKSRGLANEQIDDLILNAMGRVGFSRPDAAEVLSKFSKPTRPQPATEPTEPTLEDLRARVGPPPKLRKRPVRSKPLTLAEFLAANGGVQDQTGELKAMDAHRWHREKPFRNRLVRDDGLSPDYAREAAAEAGYLKPDSVIDDLYQALDRDLRGQKVYSEQDMTEVLTREGEAAGQVDRAELEHYAARVDLPPEVIERMDDATLANAITYEQAARGLAEGGEQAVIPGAERISDRALAERRMEQPLRPGALQRPADEGLFDVAGRGQLDLVDQARAAQAQGQPPPTAARAAVRRNVKTPSGPVETIFPDERHARLFDLAGGRPDKTKARALYGELEGFVLERFAGPADVIALAREYRDEVEGRARTAPRRPSHAPLVIDPEQQTAYFMRERVGQEAADLYTFPGPVSGLKKQWHRAATEIIDSLAEGKYSPFARYFRGYPFKDPTMGRLPERTEYLGQRGVTQGTIYRTNRMASRLNDALRKAPESDQRAALDYLTTEGADPKSLPPSVRGAAVAAKSSIKKVGRELVRRGMLSQEAYDRHADAYLPRVYLKHLMERSGFGAGLKISDQGYLKKRTDLPEEYRDLYLGEVKDVGFLVTKAISQPARDLAMTDFLRDLSRNPEWVLPESIVEWTAPGMKKPRKVTPYWLKSEAGLLRRRAQAMPDLEQRTRAREIADGMDVLADDALGEIRGVPKDFRRMPDSPRYGDLRGLVVRKEIHDDIVGASGVWVGEKGAYDKTFDKLGSFNAFWKMMKVPFNPPTQVRNMVSNAVLLDLSGVPAQRLPLLYARAFDEIVRSLAVDLPRTSRIRKVIGQVRTVRRGKYYSIAVKHGIPASTFTAAELYRIRPDLLRVRGEKGGVVGKLAKMSEPLARLAKKPGDLYQFSETWGKVVKIIDAMEREGMTERQAVAAAQEALFDYSLVPPLVRSLRTRPIGAPFITFYYKAFPAVMKGAIKHPGKMAKYLIIPYLLGDALVANLNDVTPEDVDKLRKALPRWLQDQGHVYLYPYRDESGRWAFVNYGYFLPWSMHERTARNAMEIATGSYEGSVNDFMSEVGVLSGPVPQIIAGIQTGVDPWTGREIVKDTDPPREQIYKLMMYAWRMGGPSWLTDQGVAGHMQRSLSGTPNYYGDPPLSPEQATGRAVGVNIYPTDPVQSRQRNIRRKAFEIRRIERDARRAIGNKGLSKERRADLRKQYKAQIEQLRDDLTRYRKESRVHPNLRRGAAQ